MIDHFILPFLFLLLYMKHIFLQYYDFRTQSKSLVINDTKRENPNTILELPPPLFGIKKPTQQQKAPQNDRLQVEATFLICHCALPDEIIFGSLHLGSPRDLQRTTEEKPSFAPGVDELLVLLSWSSSGNPGVAQRLKVRVDEELSSLSFEASADLSGGSGIAFGGHRAGVVYHHRSIPGRGGWDVLEVF